MEWRNIKRAKEQYDSMFRNASSILVFDTETTGLGQDAKIIQFSGIRYRILETGLKAERMMDLYINPKEPLSDKIINLTGITDQILKHAKTENVEASGIYSFLESADLWAAYNCSFDLRMLDQMSARTGISYNPRPCIDVLEMVRDFFSKDQFGSRSLSSVFGYLYPDSEVQFHSSIDDALATAKVMVRLMREYQNWEPDGISRHQCHLNWADIWTNPRRPSQKRIKLNLTEGSYGDIYWDCVRSSWSCRENKDAKVFFRSADLENLEDQVLRRYGTRFHCETMQDLAKAWSKMKEVTSS